MNRSLPLSIICVVAAAPLVLGAVAIAQISAPAQPTGPTTAPDMAFSLGVTAPRDMAQPLSPITPSQNLQGFPCTGTSGPRGVPVQPGLLSCPGALPATPGSADFPIH